METLTEPEAPRARIRAVAKSLAAAGAGAIVLGCTGMAGHAAAAEDAAGLPVIEPAPPPGRWRCWRWASRRRPGRIRRRSPDGPDADGSDAGGLAAGLPPHIGLHRVRQVLVDPFGHLDLLLQALLQRAMASWSPAAPAISISAR